MKRQILTFAALATIAVGAAITGNAGPLDNARPSTNPDDECTNQVPCHPSSIANCEISGVQYFGKDLGVQGDCNQLMQFDDQE